MNTREMLFILNYKKLKEVGKLMGVSLFQLMLYKYGVISFPGAQEKILKEAIWKVIEK